MRVYIDPLATVHKTAIIKPGAWIGPNVHIAENVVVGHYAVIGGPPEHREFYDDIHTQRSKGVYIAPGARIFEFVTIHAGTVRETRIGKDAAVFNKSHVAHDCWIMEGALIGGQCSLAGHVQVMPFANVSGKSCVAQKVVIGPYAFVGGFTYITKHVGIAEKWMGFPAKLIGHNDIGLDRAGLSLEYVKKNWGNAFQNAIGGANDF